jgi:hypothetical protein
VTEGVSATGGWSWPALIQKRRNHGAGDLHFRRRASESQNYAARLVDYALHGRSLTIREPSPPIEPGPIADASRSYRKQGDYASLVTLSNNLREGMSFRQVTALLGDDFLRAHRRAILFRLGPR